MLLEKINDFIKKKISRQYQLLEVKIYFLLRGFFYFGLKFYCPCCGGHFRKFLPYGVKRRLNAQCPKCGSLERHRLLLLFLLDKTSLLNIKRRNNFKNSIKILHIAPEFCLAQRLQLFKNYVTLDIAPSPLIKVRMDVANLGFSDDQFDYIICSHVLEHIPDDQKAIRELYRVLKPGGHAIILSPIDPSRKLTLENPALPPEDRLKLFGQADHVRLYGLDFEDRLLRNGFLVEVYEYAKKLGSIKMKLYSLIGEERIFYCIKPNLWIKK